MTTPLDQTSRRLQYRPSLRAFAVVGATDSLVRGVALSIYPLLMFRAWGDALVVSQIYFAVGVLSLLTGLTVPLVMRYLARRWLYSAGAMLFVLSAALGMVGGKLITVALLCHGIATATVFVCFNAYVLDNVAKSELSRFESLRIIYGGVGWTLGPALGVWLLGYWHGAPFVIVGMAATTMLAAFWWLRVATSHTSSQTERVGGKPLAYLGRFLHQPRLLAGWLFAVLRSCGWWFYTVYVGIYALQNGLGEHVGGIASSLANAGLFMAPLMLRWMQHHSVRQAVRTGFAASGALFILAALLSPFPLAMVAVLVAASFFLVLLDVCAGLPFLMSVKPSQRTEMSAVYSSFRDVSGILAPAVAWLALQFTPVAGVFAAGGAMLLLAWGIAGSIHRDLGRTGGQRQRPR